MTAIVNGIGYSPKDPSYTGLDIWEIAVILMILNNAETWLDVSGKTITTLEKLQLKFLRCLLGVGTGCPIPILYSETGVLLMEFRILQRKLMFIHHVFNSGENSLAREVMTLQAQLDLPGIYQECKIFLARFGLDNLCHLSKFQFKSRVKAKIRELNKNKLVEKVRAQYKKIDLEKFANDDHKLKPYFKSLSVIEARLRFKIASSMTPTVKMNFQSDKQFSRNLWTCENCASTSCSDIGVRDTQTHILLCPGLTNLREGFDLSKDKDLVDYFQAVIKLRSS